LFETNLSNPAFELLHTSSFIKSAISVFQGELPMIMF